MTTPNSKNHTKDINQGKYPEYLPEELIGETSIGVGVLIRFRVFGFSCFFLRVGFMTCMCALFVHFMLPCLISALFAFTSGYIVHALCNLNSDVLILRVEMLATCPINFCKSIKWLL